LTFVDLEFTDCTNQSQREEIGFGELKKKKLEKSVKE